MSDRPQYEVFLTPVGELVFPWVTRADTRYDPDGLFQTKIKMPLENAQDLIARLEKSVDEFLAQMEPKDAAKYTPAPVFEEEVDEEGSKTGMVMFKCKLKKKVTPADGDAFEQTVRVVMAEDGSAVQAPVYGGTMARIKGQIVPYRVAATKLVGVTLRMRAVQVHELNSGNSDGGAFWTEFGDE